MPVESAIYIQQLDKTWPLSGDLLSPGQQHIRTLKNVLKTTFPGSGGSGFSTPILANETEINYLQGISSTIQQQINTIAKGNVPLGSIVIWNGLYADIPTNYQLCDGTNGTPNLANRFIYGTTTEGDIGTVGGSADTQIVGHSHTVTHSHAVTIASDGIHLHNFQHYNGTYSPGPVDLFYSGNNSPTGTVKLVSSAGVHTHTLTIDAVTLTTTSAGESGTGKNLPTYIKMAYIMRMS